MYSIKPITVVTALDDTDVMKFMEQLYDQIDEKLVFIDKSTAKKQFSTISDNHIFFLMVQYDYFRIYCRDNTYYWFLTFPETNLHPHYQRNIAKLLVNLINSYDAYAILGTNSDFIVNELNLCYYATRDKYTSLYKEYPLTDDQICGYEIDGKNVNPCEVTEWGGLIVESFNKEITEQNRIEDEILWGEKYKD